MTRSSAPETPAVCANNGLAALNRPRSNTKRRTVDIGNDSLWQDETAKSDCMVRRGGRNSAVLAPCGGGASNGSTIMRRSPETGDTHKDALKEKPARFKVGNGSYS